MICPRCQGAATKVGAFWICPSHGLLPDAKSFAPLRIFLSRLPNYRNLLLILLEDITFCPELNVKTPLWALNSLPRDTQTNANCADIRA